MGFRGVTDLEWFTHLFSQIPVFPFKYLITPVLVPAKTTSGSLYFLIILSADWKTAEKPGFKTDTDILEHV